MNDLACDKLPLVQIWVNTTKRLAVGVAVAKDRILTCRKPLQVAHVEWQQFLVRWHDQGEWQPIRKIVWDGGVDIDAAIIDCEFPEDGKMRYLKVSPDAPKVGTVWKSCALPDGCEDPANSCVWFEVSGRIGEEGRTTIDCESGASGVPIFDVEGSVVGVLGMCQSVDGRQRPMTTTARLLEIPEFQEVLYWQEVERRQSRLTAVTAKLTEHLQSSDIALKYLTEQLDSRDFRKGEPLADRLLGLLLGDLIELLVMLYERFITTDKDAALVGSRILCLVVPVRLPYPDTHDARRQMNDPTCDIIALNAATDTAAEFIMADLMGRRAAFRNPGPKQDYTPGRSAVPLPPEGGIRNPAQIFVRSIEDQLIKEVLNARDMSIIDGKTYPSEEEKRQAMLDIVKRFMNKSGKGMFSRDHRSLWYHVFTVNVDNLDEAFRRGLVAFRKIYPSLLFITLSGGTEELARDKATFDIPSEMLVACT
ncbi:MAG: hypothetical protein HQL96_12530 [Magnetococcales bacterium]|nr:hypothetical protein [Magnetococcales bacterium]